MATSFAVITYCCFGIVPVAAFCSWYSYGVPGPGGEISLLYGYVCSAPVRTGFVVGETQIGTPGPASKSSVNAGPVFAARRKKNPLSSSNAGRGVTQVTWLFARCASTRTEMSALHRELGLRAEPHLGEVVVGVDGPEQARARCSCPPAR